MTGAPVVRDDLPSARDIVAFWTWAGPDRWFEKDVSFDAEIRRRFAGVHAAAASGALDHWRDDAEGALALILILDQFSRNLHRNSPDAFACDAMALEAARQALERGYDRTCDPVLRRFFYMPLMHAEDEAAQARCCAFFEAEGDEDGLKHAREHAEIITRFGRFPHRNPVLGRAMTPAEQIFLDGGGFAG